MDLARQRRWKVPLVCVALLLAALYASVRQPLARGVTVKGLVFTPVVRFAGHRKVVADYRVDCRECHGGRGGLTFASKP